ncbi:MAG TPA: sodium:calcium antiporter [Acidimicrobiia bacterium]|nr:sodium:calcium antiporter [Acidimicrobiia bacterium]
MALDIIRLVAGLIILIVAADRLVIAAVRVARLLNVSVVIIGAVIVGFGTSVPEFVVSGLAASQGNTSLAMSNVVASNTANVGIVLGLSALLATVSTKHRVIRREGLLMFVSVAVLAVMLAGSYAGRVEGFFLVGGMAVALGLLVRWSRDDPEAVGEGIEGIDTDGSSVAVEVIYGSVALVATVVAGQQLLLGVEGIGMELGFSMVFMGMITGVGTSLPELSAALAGARRGHSDLVLGNVLGSNIFNSLGVAGVAAIVGPGSIIGVSWILIGLMLTVAAIAGVFAFTGQVITRIEGLVLISMFVLYIFASL